MNLISNHMNSDKKPKEILKSKESEGSIEILRLYYENIIAKMPGHVFWKDKNGTFLGCNDQQAQTLGYETDKDVVGKTTLDMICQGQPDKDRQQQAEIINENDRQIMESGISQVIEEPLVLPNGQTAIFLSNKTPLLDHKGEVIGILGFSVDITAQKAAERRQLETMKLMSAIVAHELRTPLAATLANIEGLQKYLPTLIQGYQLAKQENPSLPDIRKDKLHLLGTALERIQTETQMANTVIDMLLITASQYQFDQDDFEICSINHCVTEALARYPFSPDEKRLIHWQPGVDFQFMGKPLLTIHIIFNLLKNALFYIAKVGKGQIEIRLANDDKYNILHFRDTGAGIPADVLPKIFDQFYSQTRHGAGIGLTFCKMIMEAYKGSIACDSVVNEYTEFELRFPRMEP